MHSVWVVVRLGTCPAVLVQQMFVLSGIHDILYSIGRRPVPGRTRLFLISLLASCLIYARALLEYVIIIMSQVALGYQDVTVREIRGR